MSFHEFEFLPETYSFHFYDTCKWIKISHVAPVSKRNSHGEIEHVLSHAISNFAAIPPSTTSQPSTLPNPSYPKSLPKTNIRSEMRETKLFTFLPSSHVDQCPSVFISVPSAASPRSSQQSHGTWAGLTHQVVAWRVVENATVIILEHIVTTEVLRIVFSSPICCRPCFIPSVDQDTVSLVVACHTDVTASTLIYLHFSRSLQQLNSSPRVVEALRYFIPSATVNIIHPDGPHALIALSDGRCARFNLNSTASPPHLLPFRISSFFKPLQSRPFSATPSTGPISAFHAPKAPISSLVTRFFTPRASANRFNLPGSSLRGELDTLPPHTGHIDPALAIASFTDSTRRLAVSLHASATIAIHSIQGDTYVTQSRSVLPCKLSTAPVQHFLLAGPDDCFLAVVMADEHPKADSLRVFQISINCSSDGQNTLSSNPLVCREGPIPHLVSAAYFAEDVVVATRAGVVTALINEPAYISGPTGLVPLTDPYTNAQQPVNMQPASSRGLPLHMLWTAIDDIDEPYGVGRSIDSLSDDDRGIFLKAHRFSPQSIAKALRLSNTENASHEFVVDALSTIQLDEDDNGLKRVKIRAEQIMKRDDLKVRDLSWDEQVGLTVCRERGIHIMRPLLEPEKKVHPHPEVLLSCDQLTPRGPTAWLLTSHAICQVFAALSRDVATGGTTMGKLNFIFDLVSSFSESYPEVPLTDLICSRQAEVCASENSNPSFNEALHLCMEMMQPGTMLLSNLLILKEMKTLGKAAEYCVTELPVSATFANGMVWMERFHGEIGTETEIDVDLYENADTLEALSGPGMLKKAYGFFSLAAESCSNALLRDILCALELAGYLSSKTSEQLKSSVDSMETGEDWQNVVITAESESNGGDEQECSIRLGDCAFWLLERGLRFVEGYAPKTAAAIALKAMRYAPDKQQHERMRAAAFSRFLEAGQLDHAHKAILSAPFRGPDGATAVTKEEAVALKDSIGLFINAAADRNELKWLAEQDLPEPLKVLCGQALERRARGTNVVNFSAIANRFLKYKNIDKDVSEKFEVAIRDASDTREYEDLYAWHLIRQDYGSAAQCALEWAERLAAEGPELIRELVQRIGNDQGLTDGTNLCMALFFEWAEVKREALSCVQCAARLLPAGNQYVARSRFSLAGKYQLGDAKCEKTVVNKDWVTRRLLLAQSQRTYFTEMVRQNSNGGLGSDKVEHLMAGSSLLLSESRSGVEWTSCMMRKHVVTYDRMLLCAELCCSWVEEIGDACVSEVVSDVARTAMRKGVKKFDVQDFKNILKYVNGVCGRAHTGRRNWNLIAMEQTLLSSAGKGKCPEWLLESAAHGADGDVLGVTRVLLKNGRTVDAARVLIKGLEKAEEMVKGGKEFYVSYNAIDETLETLLKMADKHTEASVYHQMLYNKVSSHLQLVAH